MAQQVSIALTGDVMLGRLVDAKLKRLGPLHPWGNMLTHLSTADLSIINLECVIARSGRAWSRWRKVFHFRADPIAIESIYDAGEFIDDYAVDPQPSGVGAMNSPIYAPAGLLIEYGCDRMVIDGGKSAKPKAKLSAWLVSDARSELAREIRIQARVHGLEPLVAKYRAEDLLVSPKPVLHTFARRSLISFP